MDEYFFLAAGLKLGYALLAVLGMILMLRWLDLRLGIRFADVLTVIRGDALAAALYYGARIIAVALLVGAVVGCSPAQAGIASQYDDDIEAAVERWWPDYPHWLAWKAQLYQESRLRPGTVSPVGAAGLAQFMPGTWAQVARELRLPAGLSPHHDIAIDAGAYYMAKLRRSWSAKRPEEDRHQLAQASYNAGLGHLLRAQALCGGAALYAPIIACLPRVTGKHSAETITYVKRIAHWRRLLEAGL